MSWEETHLAGDQRVISVTVSTMEAARDQHLVQQGPSGDDEVQLVPVARPGVPPGHPVVGFGGEEGVGEA